MKVATEEDGGDVEMRKGGGGECAENDDDGGGGGGGEETKNEGFISQTCTKAPFPLLNNRSYVRMYACAIPSGVEQRTKRSSFSNPG